MVVSSPGFVIIISNYRGDMLHVAFFWHMHQPYYRNPLTGEYSLPWVRLHALKGYYDLISLLEDYPAVRQTFNLVPSLIRQLNDYARGEARDVFLEYSRKPAEELSREEKKFLLANFFMCHWETMIKPYPGYWDLLKKRGLKVPEYRLEELIRSFTTQDFRDLQVWFNLTWTGFRVRKEKEVLRELIKKGRGFTEAEKASLLKIQAEVIQRVIPLYRSARSRGQVEITTSPFYHPILPLLMDWSFASRAMPKVALPGAFSHPEDAEAQIQKAVALYENTFGDRPRGLWPSEGSVCPEMIPLLRRAGIRWTASDEGVLFRSFPGEVSRSVLYQPYRVQFQRSEVSMVFRDRNLSDLIGFTYSKNDPRASAGDFLTHLKNIDGTLPANGDGVVVMALDGENPWEYYPDGGEAFLNALYEGLSRETSLRTVQIGEFLETHPPREPLNSLHTGSWIDQNFKIWMGHPEDNLAWNCLKRTRGFLEKATPHDSPLSPEKKDLAWEEIYIAEGSDWFWWFGDDFSSDNDEEFDRLFRMHLSNVHLLLGTEVPDYLKNPISAAHEVHPTLEPLGLITPSMDGRITHFYEWREAGYFSTKTTDSSMYRGEGFLSGFYYGFDLERLYFRIDPMGRKKESFQGLRVHIHILKPRECRVLLPLKFPEGEKPYYDLSVREGEGFVPLGRSSHVGAGKIIELSIPFAELGFQPREKVQFFMGIQKEELELERYPRSGYLSFQVPDRDFESIHWQI
jgi:alpha-amylase/alpha-mannosidase (GH57 family)